MLIDQNVFLLYRKALEDLGIPCFLGGMSRGMLGRDSPIHIRQNRRDALKDADLVLLAGQTQINSLNPIYYHSNITSFLTEDI